MHRFLAIPLLLAAASASAQVTASTDQFVVTSQGFTDFDIVGGTVRVQGLTGAISNPAGGSVFPPVDVGLVFQAQPGYRLMGEQVSFGMEMNVDAYPGPTDFLVTAFASFDVDINGLYSMSRSNSGGITQDSGGYLLRSPTLAAQIDETVDEGAACPAGHGDNGCNVGMDLVWLQAWLTPTYFEVTLILAPVPEPGTAVLCLAALTAFGFARARRT